MCHINVGGLEGWFSLLGGQNIKMNVLIKAKKQDKATKKAWHPGKICSVAT